jgi:hypothetical protein
MALPMNIRFLVSCVSALAVSVSFASEFFVAPNGADANPGTRAQPFASFQRAQQAVRETRAAQPDQGVNVTFLAGFHRLEGTVEFGPSDSGASADQPVRYRAEPGAEVVISGGRRITGWQSAPDRPGVWRTRVAEPKPGDTDAWRFQELWVNGQRALRARTPNYWEFSLLLGVKEEAIAGGPARSVRHTFAAAPAALAALRGLDETALRDVQVMVFHKWDTTRERLETASPDPGTFTTRGTPMQNWNQMEKNCLFYFENALSALDAPGEWFLDREGWLYYQPRAGEEMAQAEVVAPVIERLLAIKGQADDPKA